MSDQQKIRQKAYSEGFDLCGFTDDFEPENKSYFVKWLQEKRYADMTWLGRNVDKRLKPQTILEETQSVIVLACSYKHEPQETDYKLARYAFGQDYHLWMKEKLVRLAQWIHDEVNSEFQWRSFVDTGPVLERDLAHKAGLGWASKNTNLLNEEKGSYLFLGVIFCNQRFQSDKPALDQCGSCRLCVEACPTEALTEYQLQPAKCLAYHNIEKRGERERDYWEPIGEHLLGCDICQEVCPYNQEAEDTQQAGWLAGFAEFDWGDLKSLLQMSSGEYKRRAKASAVSRVAYADFMRNVFLVIGNTGRKDLKPDVLEWCEKHPDLNLAEQKWCLDVLA